MKNLISKWIFLFALVIVTNLSAQSSSNNIVENAASVDDFSTLVTAVKAAELVEVLQSEGPFTVFAPVNSAFAKIPKETLSNLLKPENKSALQSVLTYHVVKGNLMAKDVVETLNKNGGQVSLQTVGGNKFSVMLKDGAVMIRDNKGNMAKVVKTDVESSNGVIHVIDTVLMP